MTRLSGTHIRACFAGSVLAFATACSAPMNRVQPWVSLQAKVEFDGVALSWPEHGNLQGEQNRTLESVNLHLVVERGLAGSGKWEKVSQRLLPTCTQFIDKTIAPNERYDYRLVAAESNNDIAWRSDSCAVTTTDAFRVTFLSFGPDSSFGQDSADVRIDKFDYAEGCTHTLTHTHFLGDRIGWWRNGSDESGLPSSYHFVLLSSGKTIQVDFNAGITITKIEFTKRMVSILACRRGWDGRKQVGCQRFAQLNDIPLWILTYSKDGRETVVLDPHLENTIHEIKEIIACPLHKSK